MIDTKDAAATTMAILAIVLPCLFVFWAASETRQFTSRTLLAVFTAIALLLGLTFYLARK